MKNKRFVIPRRGNRISAALKALKMWAPSPDWESKGKEGHRAVHSHERGGQDGGEEQGGAGQGGASRGSSAGH